MRELITDPLKEVIEIIERIHSDHGTAVQLTGSRAAAPADILRARKIRRLVVTLHAMIRTLKRIHVIFLQIELLLLFTIKLASNSKKYGFSRKVLLLSPLEFPMTHIK